MLRARSLASWLVCIVGALGAAYLISPLVHADAAPSYRFYTKAAVTASGNGFDVKAADRISDVANPASCGAMPTAVSGSTLPSVQQISLQAGDTNVAGSNANRRSEISYSANPRMHNGETWAWTWWECVPVSSKNGSTEFELLGQDHLNAGGTQPIGTVDRRGGTTKFGAPGYAANATVNTIYGRWVQVAYVIKWGGGGYYSAWYDGKQVVNHKGISADTGAYAYHKQGIYEGASQPGTWSYYLGGMEAYNSDPGWGTTLPNNNCPVTGCTGSGDGGTSTPPPPPPPPPTNKPPVANFTVSSKPAAGSVTTFTSTSTDPDGGIVKTEWDIVHNGTSDGVYEQQGNPVSYTYQSAGSKTVNLRVTDNSGATATKSITFTVAASCTDCTAPAASFNTSDPAEGATVKGTVHPLVTASDASGIASVAYFIDGKAWCTTEVAPKAPVCGETTSPWGDGAYDTKAFPDGRHELEAIVTDKSSNHNQTLLTRNWVFNNAVTPPPPPPPPPPPANVAPTAAFSDSPSDLTVQFTDQSTDSDGTITSYAWNFGDATGTQSTAANPSHTYAAAGDYTVTHTVTDNGGATGSVQHVVHVTAPTPPPPPPTGDPAPLGLGASGFGYAMGGDFSNAQADLVKGITPGGWIRSDYTGNTADLARFDYAASIGLKPDIIFLQYRSVQSDATIAAAATTFENAIKGKGYVAEFWNEENNPGFCSDCTPTTYVQMLKVFWRTVKAIDPTQVVITGGLAPSGDGPNRMINWIPAAYSAGMKGYEDGVGVHPYCGEHVVTDPACDWAWGDSATVRQDMVNAGDTQGTNGPILLWGTEAGWTTTGSRAVSEQQQSDILVSMVHGWTARGTGFGPFMMYSLQDRPGAVGDGEDGYGVYHADGSPKVAVDNVKAAVASP